MEPKATGAAPRCLYAGTIREREDRIQCAITRGYDGLVNGRIRPWKQAKAEADRMRAIR